MAFVARRMCRREGFYETPVKRAIVENDVVLGVELENGEVVPAGLVVDCGGVNSAVRKSLPESLKITRNVDKTTLSS